MDIGRIVWPIGSVPCRKYSDLKAFQGEVKHALGNNEVAFADGGYADKRCVKYGESLERSLFYAAVRARHETIDKCRDLLRSFGQ